MTYTSSQKFQREFGVDVSSNNPPTMQQYASVGAKFAIVKVTEGTFYKNETAATQINNSKRAGMQVMPYFFATFSNNASLAVLESQYALAEAKALGIPKGCYFAVDWEVGDGNRVDLSISQNTNAILSAMNTIASAGYKPLLYSGAYVLKNNVSTSQILNKYPHSLWVASYATMDRIDTPDFGYFPSMDGVAIWQFTRNWRGLKVDGNISLIDLNSKNLGDDEMSWHPEVEYNQLGVFKVNKDQGASLYEDETLSKVVGKRKYGSSFKVFRAKGGAVEVGTNQWFSQADGLTKINPLAVNSSAPAIFKITSNVEWTQNDPKDGASGIKKHFKGERFNVFGHDGKFLVVGSEKDGKYFDGTKGVIVL